MNKPDFILMAIIFIRPQYDLLDLRGRQDRQDTQDLLINFIVSGRNCEKPIHLAVEVNAGFMAKP